MVHRKNVNTQSNEFEIWSCDPSEIPAWTPEAIKELDAVLIEIFGFDQGFPMKPLNARDAAIKDQLSTLTQEMTYWNRKEISQERTRLKRAAVKQERMFWRREIKNALCTLQ